MRNRHKVALVAMTIGLVAAACSGASEPADPTPDAQSSTTVPSETAPPETGAVITIKNFAFAGPDQASVGATVEVTNEDAPAHTWTSVDGSFDSGRLEQGESFEFTFTEPGEYAFICTIHPAMTGTITVTSG